MLENEIKLILLFLNANANKKRDVFLSFKRYPINPENINMR